MSEDFKQRYWEEKYNRLQKDYNVLDKRINDIANGIVQKMEGDIRLAKQVELIDDLLKGLDQLVARGTAETPSLKSRVEYIFDEMGDLERQLEALSKTVSEQSIEFVNLIKKASADSNAQIQLSMDAKTTNWKTTAALIGTLITSLTAFFIAMYGGGG